MVPERSLWVCTYLVYRGLELMERTYISTCKGTYSSALLHTHLVAVIFDVSESVRFLDEEKLPNLGICTYLLSTYYAI